MRFRNLIVCAAFLFVCAVGADAQTATADQPTQGIKKLVVKKKPHARTRGCQYATSGVAKVKVTFEKDGTIGERVLVQPSGCESFDRSALDAAAKIKFEPQLKNGEPVTVTKVIMYSFTTY